MHVRHHSGFDLAFFFKIYIFFLKKIAMNNASRVGRLRRQQQAGYPFGA